MSAQTASWYTNMLKIKQIEYSFKNGHPQDAWTLFWLKASNSLNTSISVMPPLYLNVAHEHGFKKSTSFTFTYL